MPSSAICLVLQSIRTGYAHTYRIHIACSGTHPRAPFSPARTAGSGLRPAELRQQSYRLLRNLKAMSEVRAQPLDPEGRASELAALLGPRRPKGPQGSKHGAMAVKGRGGEGGGGRGEGGGFGAGCPAGPAQDQGPPGQQSRGHGGEGRLGWRGEGAGGPKVGGAFHGPP